ncbi:SWIM zinc finger family protein [Streptomyces sp. LP11]|uniref:SWIM zinc finger family protein n=1 Tax=Streptomyces pyxinicus TaxID=2970331 RepID=A0ABT2AV07_9ACTN|nr:SWIM zinc finger family protein [Streptomyces sp. LP11]MCS0600082.1 SWIM zinc finger family protein [Streptomyces sp. LP11]
MTPPDHHPADAARKALREARERLADRGEEDHGTTGSEPLDSGAAEGEPAVRPEEGTAEGRGAPRTGGGASDAEDAGEAEEARESDAGDGDGDGDDSGSGEGPGSAWPRPGDVARAALREARATRRGGGEEPPAGVAPRPAESAVPTSCPVVPTGDPAVPTRDPAVPVPAPAPVSETRPARKAVPGTAPDGHRPGDAAREALREARREALRPEAADPRPRRRTPGQPAASEPGEDPHSPRPQAVQDMRHYLASAFRMPTWTETPDEQWEPGPVPEDPAPNTPAPAAGADTPHTAPGQPPHPAPATMAAPHRDSELRRTFPAFAPRQGESDGAAFAGSWWGNAWVEALEQGALDAKRLVRGRAYAEQGHVDAITVTPGLVLAYVRGSRPRPYRVQLRVRTLDDEQWARFLDTAADRPADIAALLDKELPQSLADRGVPLLPGPDDLAPRCSCPDSGHPCKHAAALCYRTARLLDADPLVLLLLRGRGEKDLLDALSRRSAARAARAAQERGPGALPGVRATEALAERRLPPLPPPLPVPPHPEQPPAYPAAPGGPDPFALDQLATDAAARAHALLTTGRDPVGGLTLWQDAVRLAAARPGSGLTAATRALYATLATATGRSPADLARAVAAWRQGGAEGLAVLEEPWDPPAGRFDRARPLLLAADLPAFRPWRNRLTHPRVHIQLRLGRDGLWYAYESEPDADDWWPRGTPDLDPVGALTGLGTFDEA